eukprot:scaffold11725_cov116-Cylindrotheca_fusiformis.AAC.13
MSFAEGHIAHKRRRPLLYVGAPGNVVIVNIVPTHANSVFSSRGVFLTCSLAIALRILIISIVACSSSEFQQSAFCSEPSSR